ncbi:methionyl-tRNA formyltransferase [Buchnera aphidicola (Taiwanaphis decaspermi)]|uniref:methionyl-tRNA formyltransferase n=1 Tax=Buchnera aphidicola TaxID=9 RepID=UPI0031B895F4
MKKKKIIFAGTSIFAYYHLKTIIKKKYQVVAILTKEKNNKKNINKHSIVNLAKKNKIKLINSKFNKKNITKIIKQKAHIMILASFGIIIPKKIIDIFPMGCINIHPSLLPRWRGPSPIQRCIIEGDKITGVSIIKINKKIDKGEILNIKTCKIKINDNYETLMFKLIKIGCYLIIKTVKNIFNKIISTKKNIKKYESTYARKIKKIDTLLDWSLECKILERMVRAFYPHPISYFIFKKKIFKVWKANCLLKKHKNNYGEIIDINKKNIIVATLKGFFIIKIIQIEGGKPMKINNFINGRKNIFKIGYILK